MARRWLWIAIVLAIAVAGVALVGDVRQLGDRLADFGWWAFIASLGLAFANYVIRFLRWELYLRHQHIRVPLKSSAVIFGAGLSLAITPAKLGELVKSYLLKELHDIPATLTAPVVIAERVTDLIALVILAVIGVAAYGVATTLVAVAAGLIVFGLVLLAWPRPTRSLIELVTQPKVTRRLREPLLEMYAGLAILCRPRMLAIATLIAMPAWGCECLGFATIVNAFSGAHIDLGLAVVIYASMTIAGALSFLPGGLGVTEGGMAALLIRFGTGIDRPIAFDATILTRLATLWFAVVIGLGFLAVARARVARKARPDVPITT